MKYNTTPVRGTADILPKEMQSREKARETILSCFQKNGFLQIKTPILENLSLLSSSEGGENLKLMFKTIKRGEKLNLTKPNLTEQDITEEGLRYDLTVPLARFYANNKENLPTPFKAIQIDDAFRAERPQNGRLRQFTQCDIDIFGDATCNAEIELLTAWMETYAKLGIEDLTIKINDRKILNELILLCGFKESDTENILIALDKLDKIGIDGVLEELSSKGYGFDNINELKNAILKIRENKIDALFDLNISPSLIENLKTIIETTNTLKPKSFNVEFDISVIRGQSYYTGTVFEAYANGFGFAIGGGGRYDKMIEKLLGFSCPAVGCSIGLDRTIMVLNSLSISLCERKKIALIFEKKTMLEVLKIKNQLKKDFDVSIYQKPKNINNLLNKLKICGFDFFAFADDEQLNIKQMQ